MPYLNKHSYEFNLNCIILHVFTCSIRRRKLGSNGQGLGTKGVNGKRVDGRYCPGLSILSNFVLKIFGDTFSDFEGQNLFSGMFQDDSND